MHDPALDSGVAPRGFGLLRLTMVKKKTWPASTHSMAQARRRSTRRVARKKEAPGRMGEDGRTQCHRRARERAANLKFDRSNPATLGMLSETAAGEKCAGVQPAFSEHSPRPPRLHASWERCYRLRGPRLPAIFPVRQPFSDVSPAPRRRCSRCGIPSSNGGAEQTIR